MHQSEKIDKITTALIAAQKNIETVIKNKIVKAGVYDFAYADLTAVIAAIKGPLNDAGIAIVQAINAAEGDEVALVETQLIHESGQWIGSKTPILCAKKNDPQAFGSGVSYAKRYALTALLGLPTEDDDGKAASKKSVEIPEPNEAEQTIIGLICDGYPTLDGMRVDPKKVANLFWAVNGAYPKDRERVDKAIEWLVGANRPVCVPDVRDELDTALGLPGDEDSNQEEPKELRYYCKDCSSEYDNQKKEGQCPVCLKMDVIDRQAK